MKITAGAQHTFWHSNAPGVQNSSNTTEVWELMTFYLKIGQKENENCTFCQEDTETLLHIYQTCHRTSYFWKRVSEWLKSINLMPDTSTLVSNTAFGLKPNTST